MSLCRFGLATILSTVVMSLEELVVERCYDLITTAAFRAMGSCKKLKVRTSPSHAHPLSELTPHLGTDAAGDSDVTYTFSTADGLETCPHHDFKVVFETGARERRAD